MPSLILPRSRYLHVNKSGGMWVLKVVEALGLQYALAPERPGRGAHAGVEWVGQHLPTWCTIREPVAWYGSLWRFHETTAWRFAPRLRAPIVRFVENELVRWPYRRQVRALLGDPIEPLRVVPFDRLVEGVAEVLRDWERLEITRDDLAAIGPANSTATVQHQPLPVALADTIRRVDGPTYREVLAAGELCRRER